MTVINIAKLLHCKYCNTQPIYGMSEWGKTICCSSENCKESPAVINIKNILHGIHDWNKNYGRAA